MDTPYIHIYAPAPTESCIRYCHCPICKRKRWFLHYFYEWHGSDDICLGCGDRWSDGELGERGRGRYWRRDAIASAKRYWRSRYPKERKEINESNKH